MPIKCLFLVCTANSKDCADLGTLFVEQRLPVSRYGHVSINSSKFPSNLSRKKNFWAAKMNSFCQLYAQSIKRPCNLKGEVKFVNNIYNYPFIVTYIIISFNNVTKM